MQETQHPGNTVPGGAKRGPTGGKVRAQTPQHVPGLSALPVRRPTPQNPGHRGVPTSFQREGRKEIKVRNWKDWISSTIF